MRASFAIGSGRPLFTLPDDQFINASKPLQALFSNNSIEDEMSELTQDDVLAKLAALGSITDEQRNSIVCTLIGHSRLKNVFIGYWSCARCDEQVGDSLGGAYTGANDVIVGHDCAVCRENAARLTWRDTLFAPDPFPADTRAALSGPKP